MKSSYQTRTGHQRTKIVKASTNGDATLRRKGALERLEKQLENGIKTNIYLGEDLVHSLTETDIKRIKKEISTLKSRI